MTEYSFAGQQVDVKATNMHGSAKPDTTLDTNYAELTTTIPPGSVLVPGTVAGSVDIAGANATDAVGVATQTRVAGDNRPVTYTYFGWVRVLTDNSAILVGSPLKCGAKGKVTIADPVTTAADIPRVIGRALEANGSEDKTVIQALVWFG